MVRIGNFLFRYRNGLFPVFLALLFVPSPKLFAEDLLAIGLGLAVALLGQLIRAITIGLAYIIRGGKNRQVYAEKLVQEGIFAHCRNPLYVGNILVIVGLGLISNSLWFAVIGIPAFLFIYRAIVAAEENFLRQKFGADFDAYCQRVSRFFPNLSGIGKTCQGMEFNWRRLIVKEYGSTYAWMAAACALIVKARWLEIRTFADLQMQVLGGVFVLITVAYLTARYLKKSGTLVAD
ncbi:MAG: isoprenylcysteine carboxylmethyltransferase family protein [Verrucomicrobiota bacterium]